MDRTTNIPAELLDDEIVCYLADRYHTTTPHIVTTYLSQAGITPSSNDESVSIRLEENEMEMMRGLTLMIQNN